MSSLQSLFSSRFCCSLKPVSQSSSMSCCLQGPSGFYKQVKNVVLVCISDPYVSKANKNPSPRKAILLKQEKYTDLATVENSDEMNQLINTISSAGYKDNLWIGLYNEINYRWSDGFIGSYTGNTYSYGTSQDSFHYRSHQICMRLIEEPGGLTK
uniref:C-type lectin domain-containing protein n=1 Tax=Oryzias latipes TaxID=8090 RepID=A0A3B3HS52_ORYLA